MRSLRPPVLALGLAASSLPVLAQAPNPLQAAMEAHQYTQAAMLADRELRTNPGDARLWFARGLALGELGKTDESLRSFDHVLAHEPRAMPALEAAAQVAYGAHDPRASRYLDGILAVDPGNQTAHAMAGVLDYERHDCESAIGEFGKAGSALAGNTPAEIEWGDCLDKRGQVSAALALFTKLHEQQPGNATLSYDVASLELEAGQAAQAVSLLEAMRNAGQLLGGATPNLLAGAYAADGRLPEAIAAYREAAQQYPKDERNYIDLAALSIEHTSFDTALQVLDAGIRQNPGSAALYAMRGAAHAQVNNDAAAADFEMASRLEPSSLYGTVGLGMLLRDESKLPEAESLLRARLRSAPNDAVLNYLLADVLIRQGVEPGQARFQEAAALLTHAVAIRPDLAMAHGALGKLELRENNLPAAIAELQAGIAIDPTDRMSLTQLISAYRHAGRNADAKRVAARLAQVVDTERTDADKRNRTLLVISGPAGSAGQAAVR